MIADRRTCSFSPVRLLTQSKKNGVTSPHQRRCVATAELSLAREEAVIVDRCTYTADDMLDDAGWRLGRTFACCMLLHHFV